LRLLLIRMIVLLLLIMALLQIFFSSRFPIHRI
jgi:hypothetical protein